MRQRGCLQGVIAVRVVPLQFHCEKLALCLKLGLCR